MSADATRKEFERQGAVLIRGVLSPAEVAALRDKIHQAFAHLDREAAGKFVRSLSAASVLNMPEVLRQIVHPRIVATLKAVLEPNYAVIPDFHLQRNLFDFTDTRRSVTHLFGLIGSGWHHDAGDERDSDYLFDPDYRIVKCGIYLQDNSIEWGGGIEIAPGAHTPPLRTGNAKMDYGALRVQQNLAILARGTRLEMKAGDFLCFHALLPHRGSTPQALKNRISAEEKGANCVRIPPEQAKLVIYFNASRSACAHTYMRHSAKRGAKELETILAGKSREVFFSDFPGLRYPQDYPPDFVSALRENGLHMEQLEGAELEQAAAVRRQALSNPNVLNVLRESAGASAA
jgi:hypothetical protein